MAKQEKLPYFPFYTGDWMKDVNLRSVSIAARGFWFELLCLMHESERRGYLQINGISPSHEQLARMTGCSSEEASRYLVELANATVFSTSNDGIIYSRRMTRDDEKRRKSMKNGKLGGNPSLKSWVNPRLKQKSTPNINVSFKETNSLSPRVCAYPEIPDSLYGAAQSALGWLTPEKPLQSLLLDFPAEWIESAIREASLKGKSSAAYVRGICQAYRREGVPNNDNTGAGRNSTRTNAGAAKRGAADFSDVENGSRLD